ncbi:hypothetical protein JKP88DRAFT_279132 [Tribonema minus]|uniref:Uncharacterized protein n=1 Tax=Tribonema minus TaxID=303371 RepID=A0A836CCW0_9STRA|nr:hypothetical protein JKP88DRAFT_279132 [Tribonema minus]
MQLDIGVMADAATPVPALDTPKRESAVKRHTRVASDLTRQGKHEEACLAYTHALDLSPTGPQAHVCLANRAGLRCKLGDYEGARLDCMECIRLQPGYSKLYFAEYEAALQSFETALQLNPGDTTAQQLLLRAEQKVQLARRMQADAAAAEAARAAQEAEAQAKEVAKKSYERYVAAAHARRLKQQLRRSKRSTKSQEIAVPPLLTNAEVAALGGDPNKGSPRTRMLAARACKSAQELIPHEPSGEAPGGRRGAGGGAGGKGDPMPPASRGPLVAGLARTAAAAGARAARGNAEAAAAAAVVLQGAKDTSQCAPVAAVAAPAAAGRARAGTADGVVRTQSAAAAASQGTASVVDVGARHKVAFSVARASSSRNASAAAVGSAVAQELSGTDAAAAAAAGDGAALPPPAPAHHALEPKSPAAAAEAPANAISPPATRPPPPEPQRLSRQVDVIEPPGADAPAAAAAAAAARRSYSPLRRHAGPARHSIGASAGASLAAAAAAAARGEPPVSGSSSSKTATSSSSSSSSSAPRSPLARACSYGARRSEVRELASPIRMRAGSGGGGAVHGGRSPRPQSMPCVGALVALPHDGADADEQEPAAAADVLVVRTDDGGGMLCLAPQLAPSRNGSSGSSSSVGGSNNGSSSGGGNGAPLSTSCGGSGPGSDGGGGGATGGSHVRTSTAGSDAKVMKQCSNGSLSTATVSARSSMSANPADCGTDAAERTDVAAVAGCGLGAGLCGVWRAVLPRRRSRRQQCGEAVPAQNAVVSGSGSDGRNDGDKCNGVSAQTDAASVAAVADSCSAVVGPAVRPSTGG